MIPLRLVLDTNVVVSAFLNPAGLQRTVLLLAITKPARWYVTKPIVEEYSSVIARPGLGIRKGLQAQFGQFVEQYARIVFARRPLYVTVDPADNMFLECADAAHADYLITGNARHFPKFWKQTKIINARDFLGIVAPHLIG